MFHPVGIGGLSFVVQSKGDLSACTFAMVGGTGIVHAVLLFIAVTTLQQSALKVGDGNALIVVTYASEADGFSCRTNAGVIQRVKLEFTGWNSLAGIICFLRTLLS